MNSVHCRTGSLEIQQLSNTFPTFVHCRTGSLENAVGRWS
ncbi:hypothetical protein AC93_0979 [Escherichia coli 2-005-03_S4_C2]|nr:hypothetical protein AC93_0979 [Escherichia coli 2-005-03_S4_C2]KDT29257.1 hypothetical protein AC67_0964 [Escherichia coli 2-052-05_S4_C1]